MATVTRSKVDELEEEVRELFTIQLRNDFTGVVGGVVSKRRFLVSFQYWSKRDLR